MKIAPLTNSQALGNRVHIAPFKPGMRTVNGIWLSENWQEDELQWRILSVGPGRWTKKKRFIPMDPEIQPGRLCLCDTAMGGYAGMDGTWFVNAEQILMVWG